MCTCSKLLRSGEAAEADLEGGRHEKPRLRTKITFDAEAHALRASFKYLPSTGGERDWRKDRKGQGDTYAKIPMPPAPHETYCDYLQGKISDRWLNLSWSTGQKGEYEPRAHVSGWKAA